MNSAQQLTGAQARQKVKIPSAQEYANLGTRPTSLDEAKATIRRNVSIRHYSMVSNEQIEEIAAYIEVSGLDEYLEERAGRQKAKKGRPGQMTFKALATALLFLAQDHRGHHFTEVTKLLFHRISPEAQEHLGVAPLQLTTEPSLNKAREWAAYQRVYRKWVQMVDIVDPSVYRAGRRKTWAEHQETKRPLTDDEQTERMHALDELVTAIVRTSLVALPESCLEAFDGSADADASGIRTWARGRAKDDTNASADPDAANYVREGDHNGDADAAKYIKKKMFAFDLHLLIAGDVSDRERIYMPNIAIAAVMGRPGEDTAAHTRRLIAVTHAAGHQPGYFTGDGAYIATAASEMQDQLRAFGWKFVPRFTPSHFGINTTQGHMIMVEGSWYCPSMPKQLINASIDHANGKIDDATYAQRIAAREPYLMRPYDTRGGKRRFTCPAAGKCPQVMCPLKAASMEPHPTKRLAGGQVIDDRPMVVPTKDIDRDNPPAICCQNTVTVDANAGSKWETALRYGTDEYNFILNTLRCGGEGFHGEMKASSRAGMGDPEKRRVFGLAANTILGAFSLLATNIDKIKRFVDNAEIDEQGRLYVTRSKIENATALANRAARGENWQEAA